MTDKNKENDKILYKLWKKLWGEDISDFDYDSASEDFYEKIEQQKNHKRQKESLRVKRILLSFSLVLLGCLSVFGYKNLVKNNEFFACLGKDVCIYQGPKSQYEIEHEPMYVQFSKDDFYINHFKRQWQEKNEAEIYNTQKNGFQKINDIRQFQFINPDKVNNPIKSFLLGLIYNKNTDEIFIIDYLQPITKLNLKNKLFYVTDKEYFNNLEYIYLCPYKDKILMMTNNNHLEYHPNTFSTILDFYGIGSKDLSIKESLYLLNLNTLEPEYFADFDVMPKKAPINKDIICLEDGTIIVPIRYKEKEKTMDSFKESEKARKDFHKKYDDDYIWDHVEIYNPLTKKFYAEFNINILKDNLFRIKLDDGNILFVNLKDSYIFDINKHKFIIADNKTQEKCRNFIQNINNLLDKHIGIILEEPSTQRIKYIKLNEEKYLLTCDFWSSLYKKEEICKRSIIADYKNSKVRIGPNFIYNHIFSTDIKIDNNKILIIGGEHKMPRTKHDNKNHYIQIIEVKEKNYDKRE